MPQWCVMTLTQGYISKVKVTVQMYRNPCPGHNSSLASWIWIISRTLIDHYPIVFKGVSWPWPKVISPMSRSQYTHTQNLCPGHNSSLPCLIWIIFHTIVVHDQIVHVVCHDFDPRWHFQGQGHSAHIPKNHVWAITPHCHQGSPSTLSAMFDLDIIYHTVISWPWLRVILPGSRSQFTHVDIFRTITFHW